jgi:lysozyme family protein
MSYSVLFDRCIKVVLQNEGGYSNNPSDPGGATNKGITQVVYNDYRVKKSLPVQSVKLITDDEVFDIYYNSYWFPMNLEVLSNENLVLQVFDMGVNSGIRMSIKILQRLIGVPDDGKIGPITVKTISEYSGDILLDFINRRKLFYTTLVKAKPELNVFLKGWLARVDKTKF